MIKTYDVLVAGAGSSGVVAALSAARNGASVLLIEKNGFLGGSNTAALVCPLMTFHVGETQIVKGIAEEIVQKLVKMKGSKGHLKDPLGVASTITPIEPELLKQLYFQMLADENIDLLLHTYITGVEVTENHISSVSCVNKSGTLHFLAKTFIDATGDGDMAAMAKAPYEEGREKDGYAQPMTLMFKMGGVHLDEIKTYMKNHSEQFILAEAPGEYLAVSGFFDLVNKAKENGDFPIDRDRVLLFEGVYPGEVFVNMSRVIKLRGTNGSELTKAEIASRKQLDDLVRFLKEYIPGFSDSYLVQSGATIGVRESRRFKCLYTLTLEDILDGQEFQDAIAACAFPVDIHDPLGAELNWIRKAKDSYYTIPFRSLVPKKLTNLLVAGRCIGATHEAIASARVTPTAMATGEAAGLAAALVSKGSGSFLELDIKMLQTKLLEQGAVIYR